MSERRGIPFVVSAPSGTGKTTVCRALVDRDPGIEFSISHTTRARRPGEADGHHYHFVDRAEFERLMTRQASGDGGPRTGTRHIPDTDIREAALEGTFALPSVLAAAIQISSTGSR